MFVRCRHPEAGEAEFPASVVDSMRGLGWEPISGPRTYSQAEDEPTLAAQQLTPAVAQPQPAIPDPPPAAEQPPTRDRRRAASDKEQ